MERQTVLLPVMKLTKQTSKRLNVPTIRGREERGREGEGRREREREREREMRGGGGEGERERERETLEREIQSETYHFIEIN